MTVLYIAADKIGDNTGGGQVTNHESAMMCVLNKRVEVIGRDTIQKWSLNSKDIELHEPWCWDEMLCPNLQVSSRMYKLAHFYAGAFPKTIQYLKSTGCKICYTVAAHDVAISKMEHEKLGFPFPYPHLTQPDLWERYSDGYLNADAIIVPGKAPFLTVQKQYYARYGKARGNVFVVPHGLIWPTSEPKRPPSQGKFIVGYLGALGPDKGVPYLLQAWEHLNYPHDQFELVIAGKDATEAYRPVVQHFAPQSNVRLAGWQENISDFYNSIDLYIQMSSTEGFGLEVIEAMAHARPVICSRNAGAADCVPKQWTYDYQDVESLATLIDLARSVKECASWNWYLEWRQMASQYTWDKIQPRYIEVWKTLLTPQSKFY